MKKKSFTQIIGLGISLLFVVNMYGQSSVENPMGFDKKTLLASAEVSEDADKVALENIKNLNLKIFRDFSNNFKNATGISIENEDNHTFIRCKIDEVAYSIAYNKKGRWQSTIRTYMENQLALDVRSLVKDAYPGFTIFGAVTEVSVGTKTAHLVRIENKTSWKIIRVVDGEMDIYGEYQKG